MAMGSRFHKVEPILGERATHGQPTTRFGTVKNNPDCSLIENVHVNLFKMNGLSCVENNMLMHGI